MNVRDYIDQYEEWARRHDELEADQEAGQDVKDDLARSAEAGIGLLDGLVLTLKSQFIIPSRS